MYSILAVNPGHNGSVALVVDGTLQFYIEEERVTRSKYDGHPMKAMVKVLESHFVDEIVVGGTTNDLPKMPWTGEEPYGSLARKYNPNIKITLMGHLHHLGHAAAAFYNSGFESAAAIVVDGAGSYTQEQTPDGRTVGGFETESIYHCSYPSDFNAVYKRYSDGSYVSYDNGIQEFNGSVTMVKAYEAVSQFLGFGFIEAGKTMGLSSYGEQSDDIPNVFLPNGNADRNLVIPAYPAGAYINEQLISRSVNPETWHNDSSFDITTEKNLAFKIQDEVEELMFKFIQKALDVTGETNVVISGGFALNCVANYKYLQRFPGINFYIDPVAHDGGTAIGLAKLAWHAHSTSSTPNPLTSLSLGTNAQDYEILNSPELVVVDASIEEVAKLLADEKIIGWVSGRSEAGPRALGNRSILFDPRNPDGKDIVNGVKHREWFRPFAASVLVEAAPDWFDLAGLSESPFMMYAVNVLEDKREQIPCVTHVDGTCRVQTVSPENNQAYYDLISEFNKLTGVPLVFNTSFNLAGHPLVESVVDSLITLVNSDIDFVYLADIGKLVSKSSS